MIFQAVKCRKYALHNVERWRPNAAKTMAIIEDFQKCSDEKQALHRLLALRGLRSFYADLNHGSQQRVFKDLLLAYLKTNLPGNAFQVGSTKKYLFQEEACIVTTRHIAKGEMIHNLSGRRVPLSETELKELVEAQKDFSVLDKTRYCPTSLLTGPVHLLNHSCDPNAELQVLGDRFVVKVVARRRIAKGDEITIGYGSEYFGNQNEACLCDLCRKPVEPEKQTTTAATMGDGADDVLEGNAADWHHAARTKQAFDDLERPLKETSQDRPQKKRKAAPIQTSLVQTSSTKPPDSSRYGLLSPAVGPSPKRRKVIRDQPFESNSSDTSQARRPPVGLFALPQSMETIVCYDDSRRVILDVVKWRTHRTQPIALPRAMYRHPGQRPSTWSG